MSAKTSPIGPFVGVNNRLPDHQLSVVDRGRKAGDYLRNAVNVDLTNSGTLSRRQGVERDVEGADCHSFWSDGVSAYYVDGTTLYKYPRTPIFSGLTPSLRVSYAKGPTGDVYLSNGLIIKRLANDTLYEVGVPVPNPAPSVVAEVGGSLPAGVYQVAITALAADGEESGTTWPTQVDVPENGKLRVGNLPGGLVNVYLSTANGDLLFHAATTSASEYVIPVVGALGPQPTTLHLRPMPAGGVVRWFNGRLLVASGATLFYSEPFSPALYNPIRGYVPLPDEITVVAPCDNGVYVATRSATFWLAGPDVSAAEVAPVLPYGAPDGVFGVFPNTMDVWWFSDRGIVVGNTQGQVKNVQEESVAVARAASGGGLYREQNGVRQIVASLFGSETSSAAASSWMEAEVIRKENML